MNETERIEVTEVIEETTENKGLGLKGKLGIGAALLALASAGGVFAFKKYKHFKKPEYKIDEVLDEDNFEEEDFMEFDETIEE